MNVLVTGSSGFVGSAACFSLLKRGFFVRAFSRSELDWPPGIEPIRAASLLDPYVLDHAFDSIDCILHLAGRAHVMRESELNPLDAYRQSNLLATLGFARRAALAGVRRFVFVSSIKVNGEFTASGVPFTEASLPSPMCPYAISKYEAELALFQLSVETGMEVVVVRPPLIYGPNVKGNFRSLMSLVAKRLPLPFGLINHNLRSFVSLDNLIDFFCLCLASPAAANQVFLVSDQYDVSTAELIERLGLAMDSPARLLCVPPDALKFAAGIFSRQQAYQRICGSLVVDSSLASRCLMWDPPLDFDEGLRRAVVNFSV